MVRRENLRTREGKKPALGKSNYKTKTSQGK